MASVQLRTRKDGTAVSVVLFRAGGRQSSRTFNDHQAALDFRDLVDQVGSAKALEVIHSEAASRSSLSVTGWITRYVDNLTGVEPATIRRYRSILSRDIDPVFGALPLAALGSEEVSAWINAMQEAKASGKTIANKHGFLSGALNAAVAAGHIHANPCAGRKLPRWDREEMVFLTPEEFRALKHSVPEYWRPLVQFLAASGARWSEATALKPGDVDLDRNTVRITRAWKYDAGGYTLGVPKTKKSVRTINVASDVLADLDLSGKWVFTNSGRGKGQFSDGIVRDDDGPVRTHSFSPNVWRPAVDRAKKAGLTKNPRIHDLRHTCASWLIQAGIPLPVVQQHLGHESIKTTIDVYGHLDRRSAEAAAAAIGAALAVS